MKFRRDAPRTIHEPMNLRVREQLFNLPNTAKMFVVAVNVVNPELEFVREGVEDFDCGGIHADIVENVARYREQVGL